MTLSWPNAELEYFADFIPSEEANRLYDELLNHTNWIGGTIQLFGKTHEIPRRECFYSTNGESYSYSGRTLNVEQLPDYLTQLHERICMQADHDFNAVLLNWYRDHRDSNGWHADNEKELGTNPVIASLSLGATRIFQCKHSELGIKKNLELTSGSLLIMKGEMQHHWKHQIAKSTKEISGRINLTFRKINSYSK